MSQEVSMMNYYAGRFEALERRVSDLENELRQARLLIEALCSGNTYPASGALP